MSYSTLSSEPSPPCQERLLHVAMQMGPSLHLIVEASGVWSLRILILSERSFRRFIVAASSSSRLRTTCGSGVPGGDRSVG